MFFPKDGIPQIALTDAVIEGEECHIVLEWASVIGHPERGEIPKKTFTVPLSQLEPADEFEESFEYTLRTNADISNLPTVDVEPEEGALEDLTNFYQPRPGSE